MSPSRALDVAVTPSSPPASRQRHTRWRDPRLWVGIVLVLGSVVAGAKVLASVDDTVAVWQVEHDVPAGTAVGSADLRITRVHFADASAAQQYLQASQPVGPGAHATRDLHADELLTVTALSSATAPTSRQLPLGVGAAHQPGDLRVGDRVDVWAVPGTSTAISDRRRTDPALVLRDVTVLSVASSLSGVSGDRQVLVEIGSDVDVSDVLRLTSGAQIVLVRLAG